uniref:Polysaccharide biosynthesis domain-containing protein n=1 Tax=Timema tahoe TaxID=61484 RepID=A0A7R9NWI5_9NEOP|nr:unnamed protein product [Timema tahoe]
MAMSRVSKDVGAESLMAGAGILSRSADEFDNDPSVEAMWAIKAMEHAEVYFNILCSLDPKLLRLTPHDNAIYTAFREEFPDLKLGKLTEEDLKSTEAKQVLAAKLDLLMTVPSTSLKWRPFCEQFKDIIEDFSFGTLLRLDSEGEYSKENSILVSRIQFYAIELARNREGLNDCVRSTFKPRRTTKS